MTQTTPAPTNAPTIGATLRTRRIQNGWSMEEVAHATRIHPRYLKALEDERWSELPARVYLEGFLLNFANHLGLDGTALVAQYRESIGETPKPAFNNPQPLPEDTEPEEAPFSRVRVVVFLTVLAVVATVLFYRREASRPAPPPAVIDRVEAPPVDRAPVTPLSHNVQLYVKENTWLRLWVDGHVKYEGTLPPGSSRSWLAQSGLRIQSGNFPGIQVSVDGQALALPTTRVATDVSWSSPSTSAAPGAAVPAARVEDAAPLSTPAPH